MYSTPKKATRHISCTRKRPLYSKNMSDGLQPHDELYRCPAKELLNCELLANPAAAADGLLLNVRKTPP
jgi:hypothetical protein